MPGPLRLGDPSRHCPSTHDATSSTTCWFCQGHFGHLLFRVSCSSKLDSLPCFVCQRPALALPARGSPASSPHTGCQLRCSSEGDAPGTTEPHSTPGRGDQHRPIPHHPCIHQRAREGCPWNQDKPKRRMGAGLWGSMALLQEEQLTGGLSGKEGQGVGEGEGEAEGSCVQNTASCRCTCTQGITVTVGWVGGSCL